MKPQQRAASVVLHEQAVTWAGPLPPPATLAAYEQSMQGLAERIVRMTEDEQRKRLRAGTRGQWLAFSAVVAIVGGAVACAALGATAIGCALAGATIVGVVSAFLRRH